MQLLKSATVAAVLAASTPAAAHVSIHPQSAPAGAYQVLRFGVGHGCGDQATTALSLEIPTDVSVARPQPKPGWTLETVRDGDAVRALRWRGGPLPADQFDEFVLLVRLPEASGPLAFPARQSCGTVETLWNESPADEAARPQRPAPIIDVRPKASPSGHDQQ